MCIGTLCQEELHQNDKLETIEINTTGVYTLYCRHYPGTVDMACPKCATQNPMDQDFYSTGPQRFDDQKTLQDFGIVEREPMPLMELPPLPIVEPRLPDLFVEPYRRGMELEGDLRLCGNKSSAIIHDPSSGIDIHHHNLGGGALNYGRDRIDILPWSRQSKLREYEE